MDNFGYLVTAYSIIFAVIFLYVVFIWWRQTRIEAEVRTLEARLTEVRDALAVRVDSTSRSSAP